MCESSDFVFIRFTCSDNLHRMTRIILIYPYHSKYLSGAGRGVRFPIPDSTPYSYDLVLKLYGIRTVGAA